MMWRPILLLSLLSVVLCAPQKFQNYDYSDSDAQDVSLGGAVDDSDSDAVEDSQQPVVVVKSKQPTATLSAKQSAVAPVPKAVEQNKKTIARVVIADKNKTPIASVDINTLPGLANTVDQTTTTTRRVPVNGGRRTSTTTQSSTDTTQAGTDATDAGSDATTAASDGISLPTSDNTDATDSTTTSPDTTTQSTDASTDSTESTQAEFTEAVSGTTDLIGTTFLTSTTPSAEETSPVTDAETTQVSGGDETTAEVSTDSTDVTTAATTPTTTTRRIKRPTTRVIGTTFGSTSTTQSTTEASTVSSTDASQSQSTTPAGGEVPVIPTGSGADNNSSLATGIQRSEISLPTGTVIPVNPGVSAILVFRNGSFMSTTQGWPLQLPNGTIFGGGDSISNFLINTKNTTNVAAIPLSDGTFLIPIRTGTTSITILPKGMVLQSTPVVAGWSGLSVPNQQPAQGFAQHVSAPVAGLGGSPAQPTQSGWGKPAIQPVASGWGSSGLGQMGPQYGLGSGLGMGMGYAQPASGWGAAPLAPAPVQTGWGGAHPAMAIGAPMAGYGYGGLGGTGAQLGGTVWTPIQAGLQLGLGGLGLRSGNISVAIRDKDSNKTAEEKKKPSKAVAVAVKPQHFGQRVPDQGPQQHMDEYMDSMQDPGMMDDVVAQQLDGCHGVCAPLSASSPKLLESCLQGCMDSKKEHSQKLVYDFGGW